MWIAGLFAILGAPPFGAFSSELTILRAAVDGGSWVVVSVYSILLAAIFAGMITVLVRTAQGERAGVAAGHGVVAVHGGGTAAVHGAHPAAVLSISPREPFLTLAAPLVLLVLTAILGFFIPGFLDGALRRAAQLLGA